MGSYKASNSIFMLEYSPATGLLYVKCNYNLGWNIKLFKQKSFIYDRASLKKTPDRKNDPIREWTWAPVKYLSFQT